MDMIILKNMSNGKEGILSRVLFYFVEVISLYKSFIEQLFLLYLSYGGGNMGKIENKKYQDKIKKYLELDLEILEYYKLKTIILENKADEKAKNLPFLIAMTFFCVGLLLKDPWDFWWLNVLLGGLSIFFIIKLSVLIRNMLTLHAKVKNEVEIIKFCIEVKKQNNESEIFKLLDVDSDF